MIKYTLKCEKDHRFESWFQSSEAFERLLVAGHVGCAVCGSLSVEKAMMAPRVTGTKKKAAPRVPAPGPLSAPASAAEQAIKALRRKVEATADNVGKDFATEARAIHNGEAPQRAIFGEARLDEAKSLIEDGVEVLPLPWRSNRAEN